MVHGHAYQVKITQDVIDYYAPQYVGELGEDVYAATWLERLGLSAHVLVAPNGDEIRCRQDTQGAWHAKGFNTDSLGIEVLVPGSWTYGPFLERMAQRWCTPGGRQFNRATDIAARWSRDWGIPLRPGYLDRHCDLDPERKQDPGEGFPWNAFVQEVRLRVDRMR